MPEFNLHPRLDPDHSIADEPESVLSPYVDSYETVEYGSELPRNRAETETVAPDRLLEIDGVETFAEIYTDLRDTDGVTELGLWGPTAERFPVCIEHYALQQLSQPDLYEFHALDGQVTLVIAESKQEAKQVRRDVPAPARR